METNLPPPGLQVPMVPDPSQNHIQQHQHQHHQQLNYQQQNQQFQQQQQQQGGDQLLQSADGGGRGGRMGGRGQGGGGRGRMAGGGGRGRGSGGGPGRGGGGGGQGGPGGRGIGPGPVSIAPNTGIPYGHVPAYLPGSSSLVEELDKRVLIVLRDGRHLVGTLRTFDQFSNMVLEETSERRVFRHSDGITYFSDLPMGVYVVRGDSLVLLGQIGPDDDMKQVEPDELEKMIEAAKDDTLVWDFDNDLLA